jgi:hypothetical protein
VRPLASVLSHPFTSHGTNIHRSAFTICGNTFPALPELIQQFWGLFRNGTDLNLDLLFSRKNNEGRVAAIESKFTEPFSGRCGSFQESYFKKRGLWNGLGHCRELAERINRGGVFEYLHAVQLLKLNCRNEKRPASPPASFENHNL